jgi:hypothetical protein
MIERLPLAVALTTLPSRLELMRPAIESLLAQTRRPDHILLSLPRWSRREACSYPRPTWLLDCAPTLEVLTCEEDYGPGTKLLGCLCRLERPTCLVLADDDLYYRPFFLETAYQHQVADTGSSFSFFTYSRGRFTIGQGADGFTFYSPNLDGIQGFAERALQSPALWVMDDLWISAYLAQRGVPVRSLEPLLPEGTRIYEKIHTLNQLRYLSGESSRRQSLQAGIRFLFESGLMGRPAQAFALTKKAWRSIKSALTRVSRT